MNGTSYKANWIATIAALLLAVSGITVALTKDTSTDQTGTHTTTTLHFNVDRSGSPGVQTQAIPVPKAAVTATQIGLEKHLQDETPQAAQLADPKSLADAQDAAQKIAATEPPLPTAGASAGFAGCRTQFVRNQSSRHGVRPQLQVLHYTVSPNRPGWSDVNAVVALFNRTASQASSNFVIDAEGNCAYIVPIEAKAWTQAAGNPFAISYEIIDSGNESVYLPKPGLDKLRSVMHQVAQRTGIPLRQGAVNGCVPTRTGIVQHKDFGLCGGGHIDITPFVSRDVIKVLVAKQTVPKKVKWMRRHTALHSKWAAGCRGRKRRANKSECASLLAKNALYHRLLSRKS